MFMPVFTFITNKSVEFLGKISNIKSSTGIRL